MTSRARLFTLLLIAAWMTSCAVPKTRRSFPSRIASWS